MKIHEKNPNEEASNRTIFQSMIGSLIYIMTGTRPDIAYAIWILNWDNHNRSNEYIVSPKQVFPYLNGTTDWWLRFEEALGGDGQKALTCYVNLDHTGCPDDYQSTSRLVITFEGAVDGKSREQMPNARSITDAEYYAFGVDCMTLTHILDHLNVLGLPTIAHIISNSQLRIVVFKNRIHRRTAVAQIATRCRLIADMARDGEIDLSYVQTAEILADFFTKPLLKPFYMK